jgi:hypothetical protein
MIACQRDGVGLQDIREDTVTHMNRKRFISSTFVLSFLVWLTPGRVSAQTLYFVNTTSDAVVVGACENSLDGCSLRGAMGAANAGNGDGIEVSIPASDPGCVGGVCTISLTSPLPTMTTSMSITGPGADRLVVRLGVFGSGVFRNTSGLTVTITGIAIRDGSSTQNGGGISNDGPGTVNLISCTVSNNRSNAGGGIYNRGHFNIIDSTLSANVSDFGFGQGGGILNSGTMNVVNSTISHNNAISGAGIYTTGNGEVVNITNSTISHNVSLSDGGGIRNFHPFGSGSTVNVKSSIIAMNSGGTEPDVSGSFFSAGFNLVGRIDGGNGFTAPTDQTGVVAAPLDPMLDPATQQDNGGPTMTIRLLSGSPAIDKGTSNGLTGNLTTDQRGAGFMRTFDVPGVPNADGADGTDIGAFEFVPEPGASSTLAAAAILLMLLKRRRQAIRNSLGPPSGIGAGTASLAWPECRNRTRISGRNTSF